MSLLVASEIRESPLYTQMYETRKRMTPRRRAETVNLESTKTWKFPFAAEREYAIWIDKEFRENIVQPVNKYVLENYLTWVAESKRDSYHADGIGDVFRAIKNIVKKAFSAVSKIIKVGKDVNDRNVKEWDGFVKEATGVDMNLFDPNAHKYVQEWVDLNKEFLSSFPDEYVNKINQIVAAGVVDGISKTIIARQIADAGKKFRGVFGDDSVQKRSDRIARDQVGKLNSALSRSRMSQAKVDIYKWSTSLDERVRGNPFGKFPRSRFSHYIMEGKYKQVDNANKISDNGRDWRNVRGREERRHAGQAINCRCTEIPSFIKLKNTVDADIKRDAA